MTEETAPTQSLRAAGVAGLIFSVLVTISFVIFRSYPPGESGIPAEGRDPALVGLYLIPFAGIAFLWFLATLRRRIGRLEDQFFATVFLGSGLLFVAMLFAASAAASAAVAMARFQELSRRRDRLPVRGGIGRDAVLRLRRQDGGGIHARVVDHRTAGPMPSPGGWSLRAQSPAS